MASAGKASPPRGEPRGTEATVLEMQPIKRLSHEMEQAPLATGNTPFRGDSEPSSQYINIRHERLLVAALSWTLFVWGWHDGSLGPLLPAIQATHHLSYAVVSMLFVAGCVGNVIGCFSVVWLVDKLGIGKILVLMAFLETVGYALLAAGLPFAVMCVACALNGFAIALAGAQAQTFVASFPKDTSTSLGIMLSTYGLGALISPLVATQFSKMAKWNYYFIISDVISLLGVPISLAIFRLRRQEELIPAAATSENENEGQSENKYRLIFRLRVVHFTALLLLVYVGCEVSIGGWIVTYLQKLRSGGPSAGYVPSGFFGGLMSGRILLLPITKMLGGKTVVYLYTLLVIGLQFTVWFVPNLIENAVAVSIVGLLLGPIYPIAINQAANMIPTWLLTGAIGWVAAIAQIGGALFPFTTGALANRYGVQALQPLIIGLMLSQIVLWYLVTHSKAMKVQ